MLTLSMIVKNEEKYLRECLQSVEGVADEIVLVDTGSTDDTLKIAEEFGCKVFYFNWINDFSAARNFALKKSSGNWILYLDADERLSEASKEELLKITEENKKLGVQCIVNSIDEKKGEPQIMKYIRLFYKTDEIYFEGYVHEQIEKSLRNNGYEIFDSKIEIIHVGYNVPKAELDIKARRNLELLKNEYSKSRSSYYAYQLANTYSILDEAEEACKYYMATLEDESLYKEYRVYAYMYLADKKLHDGKIDEAENLIKLGKRENQFDALLNLVASQVYLRKNNLPEALNCCRKALEQNNKMKEGKAYSKVLNIFVRPEKIIFHALYIAYIAGDAGSFSHFYNELKSYKQNGGPEKISVQLELIDTLLNNKDTVDVNVEKYSEVIDDDSLTLVLALIKSYKNKQSVRLILEKINSRFEGNSKFLSAYGLLLVEMEKLDEAENVFAKALILKEKDPSVFFYLISLYVKRKKFEAIASVVDTAEKEFKDFPEALDKIAQLKKKLSELIK